MSEVETDRKRNILIVCPHGETLIRFAKDEESVIHLSYYLKSIVTQFSISKIDRACKDIKMTLTKINSRTVGRAIH